MHDGLAALSVDELPDGICLRAGQIAAAHAELLLWIGEFDRREGWAGPGLLSIAHWLSWSIRPDAVCRRRRQLTAQIDPRSGWARQADGELLPPTSLTAVLKTLPGWGGVLRLRRLTSTGTAVTHTPAPPADPGPLCCGHDVSAEALPPTTPTPGSTAAPPSPSS